MVAFVAGIACPYSFPRSVIAIDFFLAILFAAGAGAAARLFAEPNADYSGIHQTRTLIFGAGAASIFLLHPFGDTCATFSRTVGVVSDYKANMESSSPACTRL